MKIHKSTIALSFIASAASAFAQDSKQPNIVFILADDLGYKDLSCTGSRFYETPNIDAIYNRSMVFTNGYAACAVSSPSRASILTGQFPVRHGITDWIGEASGEEWRKQNRHTKLLPPDYVRSLPSECITLPEALKEAGYKTFFAGKWHLGGKGSWPEDHGFDINVGGWDSGSPAGGYFSPYNNPNLKDGPAGENLEARLANETVKFMAENKDRPFLAYLSFYAVHGPIQTTQEKWSKYREKAETMGIASQGFAMEKRLPYRLQQDNPVYAGLVESMDDAVGIVLAELKKLGLDKNTIVLFTSDNGGVTSGDNYSTSNAPFRGGKGYQWEGGIREPYFISVPWMNHKAKQCAVPVSGTDFYPTILQLAGLPLRPLQHTDGVSLVPLLNGKMIAERALIWHYPHYGNQGGDPCSIIRKGDWKLIHYWEDGRDELYNLKADIGEKKDLSKKYSAKAKQMSVELEAFLQSTHAKFPVNDPIYDAELENAYLKSIRDQTWPKLEKDRKGLLSRDFKPNANWWESQVTKD